MLRVEIRILEIWIIFLIFLFLLGKTQIIFQVMVLVYRLFKRVACVLAVSEEEQLGGEEIF